jgi:hypothetical protein
MPRTMIFNDSHAQFSTRRMTCGASLGLNRSNPSPPSTKPRICRRVQRAERVCQPLQCDCGLGHARRPRSSRRPHSFPCVRERRRPAPAQLGSEPWLCGAGNQRPSGNLRPSNRPTRGAAHLRHVQPRSRPSMDELARTSRQHREY